MDDGSCQGLFGPVVWNKNENEICLQTVVGGENKMFLFNFIWLTSISKQNAEYTWLVDNGFISLKWLHKLLSLSIQTSVLSQKTNKGVRIDGLNNTF